jgi:hypothetical protein
MTKVNMERAAIKSQFIGFSFAATGRFEARQEKDAGCSTVASHTYG